MRRNKDVRHKEGPLKTIEKQITLPVAVPGIDAEDFRDEQDQTQLIVHFAANEVAGLLDYIVERCNPVHLN